jgi:hypothetical protein
MAVQVATPPATPAHDTSPEGSETMTVPSLTSKSSSFIRTQLTNPLSLPDAVYMPSTPSTLTDILSRLALQTPSQSSTTAFAMASPFLRDEIAEFPGMAFFTRSQLFNPLCRWTLSKGSVHCARYCPHRKYPLLAFVTDEGYLVVFHLTEQRFKYAFRSYVGALYTCAWSSDGRILAVCLTLSPLPHVTSLSLLLLLLFHFLFLSLFAGGW